MLYLSDYRAKLVWKAAPKKALHLVYGWANMKSKEALPRAADVLCQPQGHGSTALPGSAGCHSRNDARSLGTQIQLPGMGNDGYRATVTAWSFAF